MKRFLVLLALAVGTLAAQTATRTVGVSWGASSAPTGYTGTVTGYNVFRGATSTGPFTQLNASLITGLTYADATAVVGQTYTYYVTAYAGACSPTQSPTVICGTTPPSAMASTTIPPASSVVSSLVVTIP
jgi:hypothetical protein